MKQSTPTASNGRLARGVALALALGLVVQASPLWAQGEAEPTAAEVLFEEGRRLMELGQYSEACAKFRESQRLDSGTGTLMNLGRCYAKQGRTASAWATYRQAAALAHAAKQEERERVARREIAELELNLAKVRLRLSHDARALRPTVMLDGTELGAELWDVATPVDPGEHELTVSAPERKPWSHRFRIEPRQLQTIDVPKLAPRGAEGVSKASPVADSAGWNLHHTMAVIAAGVGVAGVALGTYWTVSAHADYDAGRKFCIDEVRCAKEGVELREGAILQGKLATIAFVVGGTSLAGGTVLWITAPTLKRNVPADAGPTAHESWSVGVRGTW